MMYFVKATTWTCTYCETWAGTNFEAGREMKKKKNCRGYNVGSAHNLQYIISFLVHLAE